MRPVQRLFARFVAMHAEERRRRAFAREVFGQRGFDDSALQKPACWRRGQANRRSLNANAAGEA